MKTGLITESINDKPTGIGNFARDVIDAILKIDKINTYYFIDFKDEIYKQNKIKIKNPFPIFKTYSWHNYLPSKIKNQRLDYIFNFSGTPHFFKYYQKEVFFVYDISWHLFPKYHKIGRVLYHETLFKRTLNNSFIIVVDSISTKSDLINIYSVPENKIFVVYPIISKEISNISKIQYEIVNPYMLYIGTLEPRKNVNLIINAFQKLKQDKNNNYKLILCGKKGWHYKKIFDSIKKFSLEKEVIYLGYITDEEKKYLYKHANFFVYPSFYEGFGIPVLEAMKYKCPVITSNVSSLPEVIGKSGIQINPYDENELLEAMRLMIEDPNLRKEFQAKGEQRVKTLSNQNQIKILLDALQKNL